MLEGTPATGRPADPTIAELREVTQPPSVRTRAGAEHWVASAYLRDVSPYLTRVLLKAGFSANGVTWLMIACTVLATFSTAWWTLAGAILTVVFIQLQMLLDCCDGEVARWRQTSSPKGVYLDRVGHYVAECGISVALGIRAARELELGNVWVSLGLLLGLLVCLNKVENDLVHVSRHYAGLPQMQDTESVRKPAQGAAPAGPADRPLRPVPPGLPLRGAVVVDLGGRRRRSLAGRRRHPVAADRPVCRRRRHPGRSPGRGVELAEAAMTGIVPTRPRYGVVVLTMGKRRGDLQRGLESLLEQRDVDLDVVVVGNGWQPTGLPDGVRAHGLPTNLGIPAGRNAGVDLVSGDLLFFLDDDARLPTPTVLAELAELFRADPTLGLVQPRVVDPEGRPAPRRWTPRLRASDPSRSSPAMSVWEGAVAMRREAFAYADGWPAPFWYAHEGIELAWRVWDGGWHVRYDGTIEVFHPAITPTRHPEFYRFQARNRVWLARRNLPLPVGLLYVLSWVLVGGVRLRTKAALRETVRGYQLGLSEECGVRRPMSWRTIGRMTRAGHPPII